MGPVPIAAAALAGLAQFVSIASAFWLGSVLLLRARRGGGAPERLLGLHLLLAMGAGSLLLGVASTSAHMSPLPYGIFFALVLAGNLATLLGLMAALWFNSTVFHGGASAGRTIAFAVSVLMWVGFGSYAALGGIQAPDLYGPGSWPYVATMVIADLWLVHDALRFRRQLLRRLALGLAEPLVVDRLMLWSVASLARVGLVLMAPITSAAIGVTHLPLSLVTGLLLLSATLILVTTMSLWFMLVPSTAYQRWVERRLARLQPG
jgi:hypothetical protein